MPKTEEATQHTGDPMAWRTVVEDYEADLYKVPTPRFFRREMGEVERKRFDDGEDLLKVVFRGVEAPDGDRVEVVIAGRVACEVEIKGGQAYVHLSSANGDVVPAVQHGDVAEIHYRGHPVLGGVFHPD